jgi:hypothetical protein
VAVTMHRRLTILATLVAIVLSAANKMGIRISKKRLQDLRRETQDGKGITV